jgi:hypothetical protein
VDNRLKSSVPQIGANGFLFITLPLSGRQVVRGSEAESLSWSVHSKGLLFHILRNARSLRINW